MVRVIELVGFEVLVSARPIVSDWSFFLEVFFYSIGIGECALAVTRARVSKLSKLRTRHSRAIETKRRNAPKAFSQQLSSRCVSVFGGRTFAVMLSIV
jgi:hypothetical protein